jgi:hypothetical protein
MMTRLSSTLILLSLSRSTSSFAGYSSLPYTLPRLSSAHQTSHLEIPDIERARDCAENFGVCSLDEIEEIKKGTSTQRHSTRVILSLYCLLHLMIIFSSDHDLYRHLLILRFAQKLFIMIG